MYGLVLWLLLLVQTAFAGASWHAAPAPIAERPTVAAPPGGWWPEDGTYARVYGASADHVTARRLADHAAEAIPRLARRLGLPAGGMIDVYVAPTQAQFDAMQPGVPPEWADGTAYPQWGLVFLRSPSVRPGMSEPLEQVLDHELVHILIGRAFAPHPAPRWLQEGLAQYWTGELGPRVGDDLARVAFGKDRVFSLHQLSAGFRGDPLSARLAYDASADFIGFLSTNYGEKSVRALVSNMAAGKGFDDALEASTGQPVDTIEAAWKARWSSPVLYLKAATSSEVLWGAGGILVIIGAWRARKRTQQKLARWEAEDEWMRMAEYRGFDHPVS
jgi:hypothetical protein